ncbi:transcriptional regulator [Lederbergia lenta]|uniref:LexA family protein n=1 Tax=Lederbergia lenta TaxID=1467 RepID=UPI0020410EA5|nr:transcriptional regulator [Lederbergia lenta]MCM3110698.1 transcriptional regulator [Lederbergia lenta]
MTELTNRQKDVLNAIEFYVSDKGYSPSYRELSKMIGIASVSTMSGHLDKLKEKGYITFAPGRPRTIRIEKSISA